MSNHFFVSSRHFTLCRNPCDGCPVLAHAAQPVVKGLLLKGSICPPLPSGVPPSRSPASRSRPCAASCCSPLLISLVAHGVTFMSKMLSFCHLLGSVSANRRIVLWCVTSPLAYNKCSSLTSVFPGQIPIRHLESHFEILCPSCTSSARRANTVSKRCTIVPL